MIFDRIDELKVTEQKKRGRGLGKKPALEHLSLRMPREVLEYYERKYPYTKQAKMREILTKYMKEELANEK